MLKPNLNQGSQKEAVDAHTLFPLIEEARLLVGRNELHFADIILKNETGIKIKKILSIQKYCFSNTKTNLENYVKFTNLEPSGNTNF